MKRLWALVYKEMLQIIRDPSSILIAFVLPFILLFILVTASIWTATKSISAW